MSITALFNNIVYINGNGEYLLYYAKMFMYMYIYTK